MSEEVSAPEPAYWAMAAWTEGSELRASAVMLTVRLSVRLEEKATPISEAPSETATSRKKLLPLVAVPRCRAGTSFCTRVTSSWKNRPMPAPMTKVATEIVQTGESTESRLIQARAAAATRGPRTG